MNQIKRMLSRIPITLFIRHPHPPWSPWRSNNSCLMGITMILPSKYRTRMIAPKTINQVGASIRHFFLPVIALITAPPILRSRPSFVIGIPVALAIFCLTFVIPTALLSEKESPGIFVITISFSHFRVLSPNLPLHFRLSASRILYCGHELPHDQSLICGMSLWWKEKKRPLYIWHNTRYLSSWLPFPYRALPEGQ